MIERDADIADMYALGLNLSGYEVQVARSPDSAWRQVNDAERPPALIVLDLDLPEAGGLEILNSLRSFLRNSEVPVIVLADETEEWPEAYRRGATECHPRHLTTPKQLVSYVNGAFKGNGGSHS